MAPPKSRWYGQSGQSAARTQSTFSPCAASTSHIGLSPHWPVCKHEKLCRHLVVFRSISAGTLNTIRILLLPCSNLDPASGGRIDKYQFCLTSGCGAEFTAGRRIGYRPVAGKRRSGADRGARVGGGGLGRAQ